MATEPMGHSKRVKFAELAKYSGAIFIDETYRRVLLREADPRGKSHYLAQLNLGAPKAAIVHAIASGPEGKSVGVQVSGGLYSSIGYKLEQIPVLGYFFVLLSVVASLRSYVGAFRRLENFSGEPSEPQTQLQVAGNVIEPNAVITNVVDALPEFMRSVHRRLVRIERNPINSLRQQG